MAAIRAKFVVLEVRSYVGSEFLTASAVNATSADNEQWSKATPSGSLSMTITNPGAMGRFAPGSEIYLDISTVATEKEVSNV